MDEGILGDLLLRRRLLSGLGDLTGPGLLGLDHRLDDTDGHGLTHVAHGEASERWVIGKSFDAHRLGRDHLDDGGVARLDELGSRFDRLTRPAIDLLQQLGELAGDVGGVAVQDGRVTGPDLTRVVEHDDLGVEGLGPLGRVVLGIARHVATANLLDRDVLDVEADVIAGKALGQLLVMHLDGLDFRRHTGGRKGHDHAGLDGSRLHPTHRHRADAADLVDVLERQTEGLVGGAAGRLDAVDGLQQRLAAGLGLGLLLPALVPAAVARGLDHVIAVEAGDGHKGHRLGVVADLLDEVGRLLDNLVEAALGPFDRVHLVDGDDQLLDAEGVCQQGVLAGLTVLGDTCFKFTRAGGDDENGAIGLGGTGDHVLDEITMAGGVCRARWSVCGPDRVRAAPGRGERPTDDSDVVLGRLELPEGDINGDTTLTLRFEFVQHPGILEGTLAQLGGFLFELLDGYSRVVKSEFCGWGEHVFPDLLRRSIPPHWTTTDVSISSSKPPSFNARRTL